MGGGISREENESCLSIDLFEFKNQSYTRNSKKKIALSQESSEFLSKGFKVVNDPRDPSKLLLLGGKLNGTLNPSVVSLNLAKQCLDNGSYVMDMPKEFMNETTTFFNCCAGTLDQVKSASRKVLCVALSQTVGE